MVCIYFGFQGGFFGVCGSHAREHKSFCRLVIVSGDKGPNAGVVPECGNQAFRKQTVLFCGVQIVNHCNDLLNKPCGADNLRELFRTDKLIEHIVQPLFIDGDAAVKQCADVGKPCESRRNHGDVADIRRAVFGEICRNHDAAHADTRKGNLVAVMDGFDVLNPFVQLIGDFQRA